MTMAKSVLKVTQNSVGFEMIQHMSPYNVFDDLPADTCKGDMSVVLEYGGNEGVLPVHGDFTSL